MNIFSIVVDIVKRYFVTHVRIIGIQVLHQSMFSTFIFPKKSFYSLSSQHRLCDYCHEKAVKESLMSNYTLLEDSDNTNETNNEIDLKFEVRSERLTSTTDNQS